MSQDVTLHLPAEYIDALSEVISIGIQRARIDTNTRLQLKSWWNAEKEFINSEINDEN